MTATWPSSGWRPSPGATVTSGCGASPTAASRPWLWRRPGLLTSAPSCRSMPARTSITTWWRPAAAAAGSGCRPTGGPAWWPSTSPPRCGRIPMAGGSGCGPHISRRTAPGSSPGGITRSSTSSGPRGSSRWSGSRRPPSTLGGGATSTRRPPCVITRGSGPRSASSWGHGSTPSRTWPWTRRRPGSTRWSGGGSAGSGARTTGFTPSLRRRSSSRATTRAGSRAPLGRRRTRGVTRGGSTGAGASGRPGPACRAWRPPARPACWSTTRPSASAPSAGTPGPRPCARTSPGTRGQTTRAHSASSPRPWRRRWSCRARPG
jgi:hypothetical protein